MGRGTPGADEAQAAGDGGGDAQVTLPGNDERRGEEVIAPGAELGRYQVLRRVGEGGMGVVYEAKDRELGRTVALKVLRRAGSGAGHRARRARLAREAQTMAKLAHENLVPVFDVGELAGDLFVAMELVEGVDLARWLGEAPRGWREVVQVFLQAARGLDAAHRAGVIHRDFKPSNVMVGKHGRVRVLDFGLARDEGEGGEGREGGGNGGDERAIVGEKQRAGAARDAHESGSGLGALGSGDDARPIAGGTGALTEAGAVLGTPAYLAPAQLRGEVADAQSDQYAFAVSLREALTGALPFSAGEIAARRARPDGADAETAAAMAMPVPPWPARSSSELPRQLRKLVDRAMAPAPAARFGSMAEVIVALEDVLAAAWRRRIAVVATASAVAVAVVASGVARMTAEPERPSCDGAHALLASAWSGEVSGRVSAQFARSGLPGAERAASSVKELLDRYAGRWIHKRREVCRATFVRGEQSERVMALRFGCLERRRAELAALSELLVSADRTVVNGALAAAHELGSLESCDDVVALDSLAPPPKDPARARQVTEVQAEVDRLVAQRRAGQYQEGLEVAATVLGRAEALHHPPLLAHALYAYADLENWGGDAVRSEELFRRAARLYAEVGDDAGLASTWVTLVFVVGSLQGKPAEGAALGEFASTLVARRRDKVLEAQLENHLGAVRYGAGELEKSAAHFQRALALRRDVLGAEHLGVANTLANLGAVRRSQDRLDEAEALGQEGLALKTKLLGEEHPEVAVSFRNLAALAISKKELGRARQLEEKAMAIHRRANGEVHFEVANSLNNLGQSYLEEGAHARALDYQERALAMYRQSLPAGHPLIGKALFALAETLAQLERHGDSLKHAEESLALLDKPDGNPVDRAHAAYQVAVALGALSKDLPRARKLMTEARDAYRAIEAAEWQGMAERWLAAHPEGGR